MEIRPATLQDYDSIWEIFTTVVQSGNTYAFDPETPKTDLDKYWFGPAIQTFVACQDGKILGTYILKPNQPGLGNHVANCGYMVHPDTRGKGVGCLLCLHSLEKAKQLGYRGMQFNFVVSTNEKAVKLWQKHGFAIIGTTPKGFRHRQFGFVDTYIMYRDL
jgi:L-amino acid N-acyltransferase YncA